MWFLLLLILVAVITYIVLCVKNAHTIDEWTDIAGLTGMHARSIAATALCHLYVKRKVERISRSWDNLYYPCNGTTENDVIKFIQEVAAENVNWCDVHKPPKQ